MPGSSADRELRVPPGAGSRGRGLLLAVGAGLTALLALLLVFAPLPVQLAELRTYDLMLRGRPAPPPSADVAIVAIDEESLSAHGQWPWPRYRLATLLDRLWEAGASVVALDFLLPEPDRSSPEVIRAERLRDGVDAAGAGPAGLRDGNSERLAAALRRGRSVLALQLSFTKGESTAGLAGPSAPTGLVVTGSPGSGAAWPAPTGALRSLPILTAAASAEGFANTVKDADGTLRRTPLLLTLGDRPIPSLAMAAMLLASPDRTLGVTEEGGEASLHWAGRRIPLDRAGNAMLDLRGDPPVLRVPARAVLDGTLAPGVLRGRIVLVGAWATGLGDLHLVPSGRWTRGVEVHAGVVEAVLAGRFIARPGWARGAELVALLLLGAASTLLLSRPGFKLSLAVVTVGSLGCYWGAQQLLVAKGLHLSPLLPMLAPIGVTTVLSLLKYGIEARKVEEGIRDLVQAQDEVIVSMSVLSEARDRETGLHILRTRRYVEILARQLATTAKYAWLGESSIRLLAKSAPLHDIGKVGIPDAILRKPGKLSAEEYAVMKSHAAIGADALTEIVGASGGPDKSEFLTYAREMTASHHEHWDGSGYPAGLRGEEIPLAGRLMALADVYDALVSRRAYKEALTHEQAREMIRQQSGAHFDPDVVAAFLARDGEFDEVAKRLAELRDPGALQRGEAPAP